MRRLVIAGLATLSAPLSARAGTPPVELREGLDAFVDQFLVHTGIEYGGAVQVRLFAELGEDFRDDGTPIEGNFQAFVRGEKYRQVMYLDPTGYPGVNEETAFNGTMAQELRHDEAYMAFKQGDTTSYGIVIPDPFAELLQFLYPYNDTDASTIRFVTPFADSTLSQRLDNVEWISWSAESAQAQVPGGTLDDLSYIYSITFSRSVDPAFMVPTRIDRIANGQVRTQLDASGYSDVQQGQRTYRWPTALTYRSFAPDGSLLGQYTYTLTVDLSSGFADDVFTIEFGPGVRLWDVDTQQFQP